jgi:hypothetical protein
MKPLNPVKRVGTPELAYKSLYKIGTAAALIAGVIFRRNLDADYMLLRNAGLIRVGPAGSPGTILDWFLLLQNHRLVGLTLLNLFDLVNYALVGLIFLGLSIALKQASKAWVTLAAALSFLGITVYFASNQTFAMLCLSNQYATATTEFQRTLILAAGQAVLAIHNNVTYQGSGFCVSYLLVSIAGLILALVMLKANIFSKGCAFVGILANAIGLGYYLVLAFDRALVFIPLSVSAPFLLIWYILIGMRLWTMDSSQTGSSCGERVSPPQVVLPQL